MKTYTAEELKEILERHKQWLNGNGGSCANLYGADLGGAILRDADLRGADLGGANLRYADLRDADLRGADLGGVNLRDADLRGADLRGASLRGVFGNMAHVKSLQTETYYITYTSEIIQIGCQRHTIEEWENFNDRRILEMDGKKALEWWNKWKPVLMQIIEMSPCAPTKISE